MFRTFQQTWFDMFESDYKYIGLLSNRGVSCMAVVFSYLIMNHIFGFTSLGLMHATCMHASYETVISWGWIMHDIRFFFYMSTPFPTIPMLGTNCCCNVILFHAGNKRCCCIVLYNIIVSHGCVHSCNVHVAMGQIYRVSQIKTYMNFFFVAVAKRYNIM